MTACERMVNLLKEVNKLLSHTAAKDRLIRLVQYLMKFLAFNLSGVSGCKARRLELLLIDARKVFRFLRFLESLENVRNLLQAECADMSKPNRQIRHHFPLKVLQIIQQSGLMAFYLVDHALLLSKLAITPHNPDQLRQFFGSMWLVACLSGAGADIIRLHELYSSNDTTSLDAVDVVSDMCTSEEALALDIAENRDRAKVENIMDLVMNGLNAFIALNLSKKDTPFHRGLVGACGMITSSIQLWQLSRDQSLGRLSKRLEVPLLDDCDGNDDSLTSSVI